MIDIGSFAQGLEQIGVCASCRSPIKLSETFERRNGFLMSKISMDCTGCGRPSPGLESYVVSDQMRQELEEGGASLADLNLPDLG